MKFPCYHPSEKGRSQSCLTQMNVPGAIQAWKHLGKLPPAFKKGACITAGNAPPISDGASALVMMSREKANELGVKPLASIVAQGVASAPPLYIATVPALAGKKALEKAGMTAGQLDLIEVNEAFAAVALTSIKLGEWTLTLSM
jgi:acetyl-CoA C-acetyltransferase